MKKILIGYILVLCAVLLVYSGCSTAADNPAGVAADFTLELLSGENITLSDVLKDKEKAVLVFWTTWCPSCRAEVPHIEKFYNDKKDKVGVIAVNLQENKAKVEAYVKKAGISYPVALDADASVGRLYNVRGVPTIVAIDKNRKIIYYGHSIEEMISKVDF